LPEAEFTMDKMILTPFEKHALPEEILGR